MNEQQRKAITEILKKPIKTAADLMLAKRDAATKYGLPIFANSQVLEVYREMIVAGKIKKSDILDKVLRKRGVRTMSGIAPVAVLTKPFPCPGNCAFCPTEKDVPQSYLSNEPAVMRAIRCDYHPYVQVQDRLRALEANGHEPTKIELIVIGGTWSVLPTNYKFWYIAECFRAANDFQLKIEKHKKQTYKENLKIDKVKEDLYREQKRNEKAKYNLIGITLETRPDYINQKELLEMRELGCTRVELGVQAIDDEILKKNKRGHGVAAIAEATALLRGFGFKITYHLMPGLPGATSKRDLEMFKQLFTDARFQPDQIKFYPTVVTKGSLMYRWWKQGKYKPYEDEELQQLIIDCKAVVPKYVRVIRLIRDIPGESIIAGNRITNLRQIMKDKGLQCNCIRCREAKDALVTKYQSSVINYEAGTGQEYFLSIDSLDKKTLYGFCRLYISEAIGVIPTLDKAAIIRELHVYGELVSVGAETKVQHTGLGKQLILTAEKIAKESGCQKMAIISGVGVRGYYRKLGYKLKDTYMVKNI
ncbi:tRNA uridine(34) 5-carboxymethylaminomethyl modification radical SAM/GNAT enzyme Elp3 [Candidatus Parcubacteria bacterium]|nr:tRNA uridine(34) 5-carboxymethylaminomethyl modification radical SAM/GNAT enzyme Elp3 [Patescibacteria group bacterium]MBU4309893.1 tRNA uridine(34) 5-carboxymethylaminomethyl modification radical SAM/GNAT enzyme Elp3 [Patescibacteria group bacterium]MBU4431901.1 tRNA uridine(34) 5-carboxymethylaminomethyl modification radical SAM/GNAT enzyme Elp3 [Patescibacteria group bacterium]MBU4578232.1 tRNA uridine(34) 5-carboxymethylaminomethyl modification radical SAM/GNAT enzyme Elp3 [Patescibacteri